MEPARGLITPESVRSRVDLPAPLEPTIDTIEPAATSISTPHKTCMSPYPASRLRTHSERLGMPEIPISTLHVTCPLAADPDVSCRLVASAPRASCADCRVAWKNATFAPMSAQGWW